MTSVFPTETRYSTRFTTQTDVVDGGAGAVQESTITEHIRISQVTVNQGSGRTQTDIIDLFGSISQVTGLQTSTRVQTIAETIAIETLLATSVLPTPQASAVQSVSVTSADATSSATPTVIASTPSPSSLLSAISALQSPTTSNPPASILFSSALPLSPTSLPSVERQGDNDLNVAPSTSSTSSTIASLPGPETSGSSAPPHSAIVGGLLSFLVLAALLGGGWRFWRRSEERNTRRGSTGHLLGWSRRKSRQHEKAWGRLDEEEAVASPAEPSGVEKMLDSMLPRSDLGSAPSSVLSLPLVDPFLEPFVSFPRRPSAPVAIPRRPSAPIGIPRRTSEPPSMIRRPSEPLGIAQSSNRPPSPSSSSEAAAAGNSIARPSPIWDGDSVFGHRMRASVSSSLDSSYDFRSPVGSFEAQFASLRFTSFSTSSLSGRGSGHSSSASLSSSVHRATTSRSTLRSIISSRSVGSDHQTDGSWERSSREEPGRSSPSKLRTSSVQSFSPSPSRHFPPLSFEFGGQGTTFDPPQPPRTDSPPISALRPPRTCLDLRPKTPPLSFIAPTAPLSFSPPVAPPPAFDTLPLYPERVPSKLSSTSYPT